MVVDDPCTNPKYLPTVPELIENLGPWSFVLYTAGALNTFVQSLLFLSLLRKILSSATSTNRVSMIWITSLYFVLSLFILTDVFLPRAGDFLWLTIKIYVGITMGHFVDLTVSWHGGETGLLAGAGPDTSFRFRTAPCCCCLCLPTKSRLTKAKVKLMRGSVYQIPYTQSFCLILLISLQMAGYVKYKQVFSLASPSTYITIIITVSFLCGLWGLFMFFNITQQLHLLQSVNYRRKSNLMRVTIAIINFQAMIINVCNRLGWISCMPGMLSATGVAWIIKMVCLLLESLVLGSLTYVLYTDDVKAGEDGEIASAARVESDLTVSTDQSSSV